MNMAHQQLALEERTMIYGFCKAGFSQSEIAKELGRHKSTISREIKRNTGLKRYRPKQADEKAAERRRLSFKAQKWTSEIQSQIESLLKEKWSPEQISDRLKKTKDIFISHQRIYQFVYKEKDMGGVLYKSLRQGNKKRRKKYGKTASKRGQIQNRVSIKDRPADVDNRLECGHWEGDTIIGKNHKKAMITLVERKYGFSIIEKVESKNSDLVAKRIIKIMGKYKSQVKSITFDNGLEFAGHETIAKALKCNIYFAEPYSSYQRGTNENTNGLFRQYFPKGSDFDNYSEHDIKYAMDSLNDRPRKRLEFFTPNELFLKKRVAFNC
jgi:IS30 family transposase